MLIQLSFYLNVDLLTELLFTVSVLWLNENINFVFGKKKLISVHHCHELLLMVKFLKFSWKNENAMLEW